MINTSTKAGRFHARKINFLLGSFIQFVRHIFYTKFRSCKLHTGQDKLEAKICTLPNFSKTFVNYRSINNANLVLTASWS
jgi:hypothetical protein